MGALDDVNVVFVCPRRDDPMTLSHSSYFKPAGDPMPEELLFCMGCGRALEIHHGPVRYDVAKKTRDVMRPLPRRTIMDEKIKSDYRTVKRGFLLGMGAVVGVYIGLGALAAYESTYYSVAEAIKKK